MLKIDSGQSRLVCWNIQKASNYQCYIDLMHTFIVFLFFFFFFFHDYYFLTIRPNLVTSDHTHTHCSARCSHLVLWWKCNGKWRWCLCITCTGQNHKMQFYSAADGDVNCWCCGCFLAASQRENWETGLAKGRSNLGWHWKEELVWNEETEETKLREEDIALAPMWLQVPQSGREK